MNNAKFLKIVAQPRYWEDAQVNGKDCDEDDYTIPCREGNMFNMTIDLDAGQVLNWVGSNEVYFHLKVCDAGQYYLYDNENNLIAEIDDGYVPSGVSHGDSDYGDYIIMKIDSNGYIQDYTRSINEDNWTKC